MNNKNNFWEQVGMVIRNIMEHINITYDGANKAVQIRIVSAEDEILDDPRTGEDLRELGKE